MQVLELKECVSKTEVVKYENLIKTKTWINCENQITTIDDFIFDNEMVSQIFYKGYQIGEVTCPTKYFEEASSINFSRSMKYGLGCLKVSVIYRLCKWGLMKSKLY